MHTHDTTNHGSLTIDRRLTLNQVSDLMLFRTTFTIRRLIKAGVVRSDDGRHVWLSDLVAAFPLLF